MKIIKKAVKNRGITIGTARIPQINKLSDVKQDNFLGLTRAELIHCINSGISAYLCNKVRADSPIADLGR